MRWKAKAGLTGAVWVVMQISLLAQTPPGINYQAVARDHMGNELATETIDVRFSILSGSPSGTLIYEEVHANVQTSKYGVFNLVIGSGVPSGGMVDAFDLVAWEEARHYLKVEIKFDQRYLDMGTMQFLAVPYALYAYKSLEPGPAGPEGPQGPPGEAATDDQTLSLNGTSLSISGGNAIDMTSLINDPDSDPQNELQNLNLNTDILTLSQSSSTVDLSKYLDNTDQQQLSFDGNNLSLEGGGQVNLSSLINDADHDTSNELQYLSLKGDTLSITNGNYVTFAKLDVDDDDPDPANELQHVQLNGDELTLTDSPISLTLSKYLDNTDNQQLGFNTQNYKLGISGADSVNLSSLKNDADADPANEIQDLQLNGNMLTITLNGTATEIDLTPYLDNTDAQDISKNELSKELSITNGSTLDLSEFIKDADADATNELVTGITYDGSELTLTEAGFNHSVNLGANIIGFQAEKTTTSLVPADDYDFEFDTEVFDGGNGFEPSTGVFTVPADGLYSFTITYNYQSGQSVILDIDGGTSEIKLIDNYIGTNTISYTTILSQNQVVKFVLRSTSGSDFGTAVVSGYKIK